MKIEIETGKKEKKIEDWEVQSALDCLIRAKEIQANTELMAKVKAKAKGMKAAITSIADIKNAYNQMVGIKEEDDFKRSSEELELEEEVQSE